MPDSENCSRSWAHYQLATVLILFNKKSEQHDRAVWHSNG